MARDTKWKRLLPPGEENERYGIGDRRMAIDPRSQEIVRSHFLPCDIASIRTGQATFAGHLMSPKPRTTSSKEKYTRMSLCFLRLTRVTEKAESVSQDGIIHHGLACEYPCFRLILNENGSSSGSSHWLKGPKSLKLLV